MTRLAKFLRDEDGAVTVDFVVLAGGIVGLGMGTVAAVSAGQRALGTDIRSSLEGATVAGNPVYTSDFGEPGMLRNGSWFVAGIGTYDGWEAIGSVQRFEVMDDVYARVTNPSGNNMLDMGGSPGNMSIGRTVEGLQRGERRTLTFSAADWVGNNKMDVYFGGELLGSVDPGESMESYSFNFRGGAGDGSNQLVLTESGRRDNVGTYIADITIR